MAAEGKLLFPVIAVNDTPMKRFFDNVHGTGESALTSIMITTNTLIAGNMRVVAGYGYCGRGLAKKVMALVQKSLSPRSIRAVRSKHIWTVITSCQWIRRQNWETFL